MQGERGLSFKIADRPWEFDQVHRLNYKTFVEEIPQHSSNPSRVLIDRLLVKSTCFVCLKGQRLVGMVAVCGERPFSLDAKLPNLDAYIPPGSRPCEIRLLAVERDARGGAVLGGLARCLLRHCREQGYDVALVSAAVRQEKLYRHLGFLPFGPPLGTDAAPFQGMYLTWQTLSRTGRSLIGEGKRV